ncbi:DNA-binding CsgD family transcriptional regulator [Streptacidiphilus sp. MAP12-20]|uniref:response regulator transcription factor n=1 Tax=Streptacidiphilus sp. MAP12-20 TaxID=3156299 RepID=UPI003514E847
MATSTPPTGSPVTDRERQILQLVAEGQSNQQIGQALDLSPLTVKSHLARITSRYGTHNRAGLVGVAFRRGDLR